MPAKLKNLPVCSGEKCDAYSMDKQFNNSLEWSGSINYKQIVKVYLTLNRLIDVVLAGVPKTTFVILRIICVF